MSSTSRRDSNASNTSNPTKVWKPEWKNATPEKLGDLKAIADGGGVKMVADKLMTYFQDEEYQFWYYRSEDRKSYKVVVSEKIPTSDMSLTGNAPALGMEQFTVGATSHKDKWLSLANQIELKAWHYG